MTLSKVVVTSNDRGSKGHFESPGRDCYKLTLVCYISPRCCFPSLGIQSLCQMMIGVYNHLLKKVFRFYYHSQKAIGSLGHHKNTIISYLWQCWKKQPLQYTTGSTTGSILTYLNPGPRPLQKWPMPCHSPTSSGRPTDQINVHRCRELGLGLIFYSCKEVTTHP